MLEKFRKAKNDQEVIFFKNFQESTVTWDSALKFVFDECQIPNSHLKNKKNADSLGNVQIQDHLWLAPQTNSLFDIFPDVQKLLYKVNDNKENRTCSRYTKSSSCDCDVVWHTQGLRISLSPRYVPDHNDPWDILYWQVLGTSFWKINNDVIYELNPGDMLYFSQKDSHAVWCEGPRAGFIIDGIGLLNK